ncbi:MAG: ABC transporter substrate-binding protein [Bacteroides sp.]|nr:ABC transporter substrate-binding protein [Eubacterium sp.]MCM1418794.1 ABC transporter substrate-binding protein [Roseburia sp.]MCM1462451.1 ABC transporter substrate-binding protein [Bacteroides sp.]
MKTLLKKLGAGLCTVAMLASFAGCSDEGSTPANNDDANANANVNASSNEGGTTGGTLKIGGIGPITGGAAVYGQAVKNAAEIAVEEINAAGGINGMTVEFKYEDDVHDPEKSVNAYNTLKDWGMQILMGTVTSGPCQAVVEETHKDSMFQLTPSGSAVECVKYDNAFRVCFSDPNQGVGAAEYIGVNGLASKVAIIYNSSDIYSTGIYEKFAEEAANQPFEIVSAEAFTEDSKTDFSVQIQKAKDSGADLVFLPIYYQEASLILSQSKTAGLDVKFFGVDGMDGILSLENFDITLTEGVMLLTPFAADATDDKTVAFVTKYVDRFGETPNQFAADAYDAMYIIKDAAEKAGVTSDMSISDLCSALSGAMTGLTFNGLTGDNTTWEADGEPSKAPKAVVIVTETDEDGVTTGSYKAMQ